MQLISIEHRTAYAFSQTVALKPHRLLLRPRDGFDLRIRSSALTIEPKPDVHWARDSFGNNVAIATFGEKTKQLDILSSVIVEQYQHATLDITLLPNLNQGLDQGLEQNPDESSPELGLYKVGAASCIEGSHWSQCQTKPKRSDDAFHQLTRFCETLHEHIDYIPRSQPGVQSPLETAQRANGCCRDIAWLFIQATRRAGFASRFVSGYLVNDQSETLGPSDQGATHAWAETYLPSYGWLGFDPTLGRPAGPKHVAVAAADRSDSICPVTGAFVGPIGTTSTMAVTVKCERVDPSQNSAKEAFSN